MNRESLYSGNKGERKRFLYSREHGFLQNGKSQIHAPSRAALSPKVKNTCHKVRKYTSQLEMKSTVSQREICDFVSARYFIYSFPKCSLNKSESRVVAKG